VGLKILNVQYFISKGDSLDIYVYTLPFWYICVFSFSNAAQLISVICSDKFTQLSNLTEKFTRFSNLTEKFTQLSNLTYKFTQLSNITDKFTKLSDLIVQGNESILNIFVSFFILNYNNILRICKQLF